MRDMKKRSILLALGLCFAAGTTCFASPEMGTWKLSESKSTIPPGMPKNQTVVYAAAGDSVKVTVDGVDSEGKPTHNEWTGKFDGKDYPLTGDANGDMRSYKKIDDLTLEVTVKKAGNVIATSRLVISADGKTRTLTTTATNSQGKKSVSTAVYDKQ